MELRHLRYFVAVAEELNFTRAAERLRTAQPSLSQQIKRLEAHVGTALFERNKRHVQLTGAGGVFLEEAREILARTETAVQHTREAAGQLAAEISVAVTPAAEVKVLPKLLPLLRRRMPGVRLVLHNFATTEQVLAFKKHSLDAGFLRGPFKLPGVVTELLLEEKLVIALPAKHPLAAKKKLRVEDLNPYPFIMVARESAPELHDALVAFCERSGLRAPVVQHAHNVLGNLNMIRSGVGFGLLPDYVEAIQPRGIVLRPLDVQPEPCVPLLLARSTRSKSPLLGPFIRLVRECFPQKAPVRGGLRPGTS